jgi:CHAD domain-containing protein
LRRLDPTTYNQMVRRSGSAGYPTMNPHTHLGTLWRARVEAVVRAWSKMRRGDARAVHRTRVASRRIREGLPIVGIGVDRAKLRKLNRKVRAITRALGPVRALDAELVLLARIERAKPAHRAAVAVVRKHLTTSSRAARKRMFEAVDRIDLKKLVRRLTRVGAQREVDREQDGASEAAWRNALAARTVRRATRLREAIDQAGALYVPERLHAVRIATKKLRYVLEVVEEAQVPQMSRLVHPLKGIQGTLGRLHDLQSLLQHARAVQASGQTTPGSADLEGFVELLERECRRLHARFVPRRDALTAICERARLEISRQVLVSGPQSARMAAARLDRGPGTTAGSAALADAHAGTL